MINQDINIYQNISFSGLTQVTGAGGAPIDLSNYNVTGSIQFRYSDHTFSGLNYPIALFDCSILAPSGSGIVQYTLPPITGLPILKALYQVKVYNESGSIGVIQGFCNINPELF